MKTEDPQLIRLADYTPPLYLISCVDLEIDLKAERTVVAASLAIHRREGAEAGPLVLDGEELELLSIAIDGDPLDPKRYDIGPESLTIHDPPASFTLETQVAVNPAANTRLEGLYRSNTMFCTQCEAEGFRRITWFIDRPDVMARYRVTLIADKAECPVLLSNGNNVETADLDGGRHMAVWEDPFPKPSYLFAMVAGDLACVEDSFTTASGRPVTLRIFVEHGNETRCDYAMDALKRSMKWDEDRFGLEYDLDIFNIVAVSDFNMGAMENKSLNIFNAKYILADKETATDQDFANIEAIVAHEYFHNWTGNRVTCRDWFQLSLKEGLTVFRDQEFTSDARSRPVKRVQDVRMLRARQFPEDAGPLAHPVRPDSYMEINNFYTATVYEKGAEVIRMMHALLGEDGFQAGMRLYFERHDGQAVTCDDFVAAMEDATGADLGQFRIWYEQAGTPHVACSTTYDGAARELRLKLTQRNLPTPGQAAKRPLHIPLSLGLIGANGGDIPLVSDDPAVGADGMVHLTRESQEIRFTEVPERPVLSINRGFSAPVIVKSDVSDGDLGFQMAQDSDPFARWDAGQQLASRIMLRQIEAVEAGAPADRFDAADAALLTEAFEATLTDTALDPAFKALACTLPSEDYIGDQIAIVPVDAVHAVRRALMERLGSALKPLWTSVYADNAVPEAFEPSAGQAGRRALRNTALAYLASGRDEAAAELAKAHFDAADNMTDSVAALAVLCGMDTPLKDEALASFEAAWSGNDQVMDKWFSLQAMAPAEDALDRVKALAKHRAFDIRNPNKVRSLIGAFAVGNTVRFHAADGSGYRFLANAVIELDSLNPQVAARMLGPLCTWRRYDENRRTQMKAELSRIAAVPVLSRDSFEIASKSLADAPE